MTNLRQTNLKCMLLLVGLLWMIGAHGQGSPDRFVVLGKMLDSLSSTIPGLRHQSDLALSDVPLHDYVRALGRVHQINVYIDDKAGQVVTSDFVNESVKSIFVFLCKKFDLTIEPVGSILHFKPYEAPKAAPPPVVVRQPVLEYKDKQLSFDLNGDSLGKVLRLLSRQWGETIVTMPGASQALVSGYIPASEPEKALENMLFMNGFGLQRHRKGFYIVQPMAQPSGKGGQGVMGAGHAAQGMNPYQLTVGRDTMGGPLVFLEAEGRNLSEVVNDLFAELGAEYILLDALEGQTTLNIEGAGVDEVLKHLLQATDYTYLNDRGVYVIGRRTVSGLRQVEILNLKYRPTSKVIELMPSQLKEDVELKEFVELNRIIVSGPSASIMHIRQFVAEIDRPVPMVKIEMIVVDVDFNRMMQAGIKAGLAQPGDTMSAAQALLPGLSYTLTGTTINGLLAASGVPALAALGMLKSNFYVQLQAQESRGNLKVVTRPVISTLNGNEATITIGQRDYYRLETNTAANGAVNSFNQVSQRFETIDINTTITVKPFVSQDGMVTLELKPNFTSPGVQTAPNIPPSILTRSFQSTIRVKDGETVVLGGLSRESNSTSTEGLPFMARVPILRWFFGKNSKSKSRSSLLIYITPTVYYN